MFISSKNYGIFDAIKYLYTICIPINIQMQYQKILILGNNHEDTDVQTTKLAKVNNLKNHGLINNPEFKPNVPGYYHTSLVDLSYGEIIHLSDYFDRFIMLDQPEEEWSHGKILLTTFKVMLTLKDAGKLVEFENNKNIKSIKFFYNLLKTNKSFCIFPWILLGGDYGNISLCTRSEGYVDKISKGENWNTNNRRIIKDKMLAGIKNTEHCNGCYFYESQGVESSRIFETLDWTSRLNITNINDLEKIDSPYYYEIRLDNKCNLACRICRPRFSNLINEEFLKLGIDINSPKDDNDFPEFGIEHVNIDTLSKQHRVYVAGGEPTFNEKFYQFLEKCIEKKKTDFNLCIGTNGTVATARFMNLINQFSNVTLSISVDGYGEINDYIRWPSKFNKIMDNSKKFTDNGHFISFNCVVGLYNVTNFHLLFEYIDQHFPDAAAYLQLNYEPMQDARNHPMRELAAESMKKCQQTKVYHNDSRGCKTIIDSLYNHYTREKTFNSKNLKEFFEFNDKLDNNRNIKLDDYIPELAECRKYI